VGTAEVTGGTFRLLWLGQSVSVLGDGATLLAVPLLMLKITHNPALAALSATPRTVAYLFLGMLAGPLSDWWDSRRTLLVCDVGRAAVFAAIPFAVHLPGGAWYLLALSCLSSGIGVLFETSLTRGVQALLRPADLVAGNAWLEMSNQVGVLLGPAAVGIIITFIGINDVMWLNAATFLASVLSLLPLRWESAGSRTTAGAGADEGVDPPPKRAFWRGMWQGITYIRANPLIFRLVIVQVTINFVVAVETLVVFYATVNLHVSPAWTGIVVGAAGVGGVLAASVASRTGRGLDQGRLIGWSVVGIGGSLVVFSLSVNPFLLIAANLLDGALSVFASIQIRAVRQRIVPAEVLGRVTANARTLAFAANPLGAVVFGAIAAAAGNARWSFAAAALLSIVSGTVAYRGLVSRASRVSEPIEGSVS